MNGCAAMGLLETGESRMRRKSHVRFGERCRETGLETGDRARHRLYRARRSRGGERHRHRVAQVGGAGAGGQRDRGWWGFIRRDALKNGLEFLLMVKRFQPG